MPYRRVRGPPRARSGTAGWLAGREPVVAAEYLTGSTAASNARNAKLAEGAPQRRGFSAASKEKPFPLAAATQMRKNKTMIFEIKPLAECTPAVGRSDER